MKNKSSELLEISPYGKVPVLVDNNRSIYESAIINEYLEEAYPDPPLMPEEPFARAQARIWTDYSASQFNTALRKVYRAETPEETAENLPVLKEKLAYMESHLEKQDGIWLVGNFSLADINLLPFVHRTTLVEGNLIQGYPALSAWFDAFSNRKSFQETLTDITK